MCDLDYLNCSLVGSGKGSFFGIFLSGIFFMGLGVGVLTKKGTYVFLLRTCTCTCTNPLNKMNKIVLS